jgi:hypothetical protein
VSDPYAELQRAISALEKKRDLSAATSIAKRLRAAAEKTRDTETIAAVEREIRAFEFSGSIAPLSRALDVLRSR